jgi:HAD superfamily hydrolase (TIGR01544 family)
MKNTITNKSEREQPKMEILISHPEKLEEFKKAVQENNLTSVHIVSDFDRTLTYGSINGQKTPSLISILRDGNYLTPDYASKAEALFEKYHPQEIDLTLSFDERKKAMQAWWTEHNQLLIESGLSKKDLEAIATSEKLKFREGVLDFLDFTWENKIPLIIFSSSGCGEVIQIFFQKHEKNYPNIHYVTNHFIWDENGLAQSSKKPLIHCLNKDETILEKIPSVFQSIQNRRNVILLGDGTNDLGMIEGFKYDHLLKIGFLNPGFNDQEKEFKSNFDIVLRGDGDFHYVNQFFRNLI